jgi:hypothetical protein
MNHLEQVDSTYYLIGWTPPGVSPLGLHLDSIWYIHFNCTVLYLILIIKDKRKCNVGELNPRSYQLVAQCSSILHHDSIFLHRK